MGGLDYANETKSTAESLQEEYEGGNDIGGSSSRQGPASSGIAGRTNTEEYTGGHSEVESKVLHEREQRPENNKKVSSRNGNNLDNRSITFTITAYTAGFESTGKSPGDKAYGITASGAQVKENHTVAADWSVLPPGTKLRIEGLDHIYTVEDRGSAITGNRLDIYIPDLDDALRWGVRERKVTVIEMGGK